MLRLAYPIIVLSAASALAQDLPTDPGEPMDIEPPLLIHEISGRGSDQSTLVQTSANALDPDQINIALEKARKSAAAGERLYRSGIIAKVEAENRALKVVGLEADLAKARLEIAKQNAASQQTRFDASEISPSELEMARSALVAAEEEAASATAHREKAELEAALLNLRRQKKLLALGSGRKSEVSRAEEKVATLQQAKD